MQIREGDLETGHGLVDPRPLRADIKTKEVRAAEPVGPRDRPPVQIPTQPTTTSGVVASPEPQDLSAMLNRVFHDVDLDGSPLVWTPRYKARVTSGGLTYRPFLGSDAPRTYPIRLSLDRVSINGARMALDPAPRIGRDADRVSIQRGSLVEHYNFAVDSAEQAFVLPEVTKGAVLVEVDLDVDSEYDWSPTERAWTHERGSVSLSEAVVFTTGGQELAIPCDVEGDRMSMRVPADFLETAEGAIVIDPVISTDSIETVETEFVQQTSAAYDPSTDRYCVSVGFHFANDDRDTMSILVSGTTAEISAPVTKPACTALVRAACWKSGRSTSRNISGRTAAETNHSAMAATSAIRSRPKD